MYREKRRNKIIILILIGIMCIMGVGYAAFKTSINITGTTDISSSWDIKIISADAIDTNGTGENVKNTYNDLSASLEANLYEKGDYVEYSIIVENKGTFDAKLETIGITNSNNEAVKITGTGLTKGQTLYQNSTATLKVKIEYNSSYEGDASGTSGEAKIDLDFVQNSGGTIEPETSHLVTYDYSTNGGSSTTAENEYINEGESINLSYTATKEGYDFIGWNTNKDAQEGLKELTMGTSDITLYAIFRKTDTTPPIIENVSTSSTTNSITVVVTASDEESEISKYEFKRNGGEWIDKRTNNIYTFTDLTQNTSYDISVRVTNEVKLTGESEKKQVITKALDAPIFSEEETDNGKIVTISYPEGEGLTYEYQKDSGSWQTATQNQQVIFNDNGTLVARVSDGVNEMISTYVVKLASTGSDLVEEVGTVTSGDGLYKDSYEENIYTYRGGSPNNYVTFNNEEWRIISINTSNNTIKIMRNTLLSDKQFDTSRGRYQGSSGYCNNRNYGCNIWGSSSTLYDNNLSPITKLAREISGTKYTLPTAEAPLNIYLNGEYYNGLNSTAKEMIKEDAIYKVGPIDYTSNNSLNIDINYANQVIWKGKIALIDATEYIRASINSNCTNMYAYVSGSSNCYVNSSSHNWMFNSDAWWSISPSFSGNSYSVWTVTNGGYFYDIETHMTEGVRPVLTLSEKVKITGGNGSLSQPYRLTI